MSKVLIAFIAILTFINSKGWSQTTPNPTGPAGSRSVLEAYRNLPLSFEANHGQTDSQVQYLSHGSAYSLFLTQGGAVVSLERAVADSANRDPRLPARRGKPAVFQMKWTGSNPGAKISGNDRLPAERNYLIGNDPANWHTKVPTYGKVRYEEIYPGVDLLYYGNGKQLEYDLVVAPGARVAPIRFRIEGASKMMLEQDGDLSLAVGGETVRLHRPVVYQEKAEGSDALANRELIAGGYVMTGKNEVGFKLGKYDPSRRLIIDPQLIYSSYLGGGGSDKAQNVAADANGNAYVVGFTSSINFPVVSPRQASNQGVNNAFVAKFNTNSSGLSSLVYSTYLGGSGDTFGRGIAIDGLGQITIAGNTNSPNFPVMGAYQATCKLQGAACSTDIFATRLDSTGTSLVYSTYVGGTGIDFLFGMAVDGAGHIFLTGPTGSTDFPTSTGAFQTASAGGSSTQGAAFVDAFVTKIDPGASGNAGLMYSTYLGGSGSEQAWAIAVDNLGAMYVTGSTTSTDFPLRSAFSTTYSGTNGAPFFLGDAFVSKIVPNGLGASDLAYSTYLGGASDDRGEGIAVDANRFVYVTGFTESSAFPVTSANAYQSTYGGGTCSGSPCGDAFLAKIDATASGSGSLLYSTFFGGSSFDLGHSIALDGAGKVYVAGETGSLNFPLVSPIQRTCSAGCTPLPLDDTFLAKFDLGIAGSGGLLFSTYLGGDNVDTAWGVAVNPAGEAFVVGQTFSRDFPTVKPYQLSCNNCTSFTASNPSGDSFLYRVCTVNCAASVSSSSLTFGMQALGTSSAPQNFTFTNGGASAVPLGTVGLSGTNSGDYSQTNNCPATLQPAASCTISVTFTPGAVGSRTAVLTFQNESAVVQLSGTGTAGTQPPVITIVTSPPGFTLIVDGSSVTGTYSAIWLPGSSHTIGAPSPQQSRFIFTYWSDAGAQTHTVTSPAVNTTYTGNFGPNVSNVGVFRQGFFWLQDLDGNRQFTSPPDAAFAFGGIAGDIPITGDWTGSGTSKVGVYRPANGLFILDSNGNGMFDAGDAVYNLGVGTEAGDLPVIGDWNGDGRSKVGLFRQGYFWILDYNGDGVFSANIDKSYAFGGDPGDVPVVGDWSGDGKTKIGLFRQGYYWVLDLNGNGAVDNVGQPGGDKAFPFGGISGDVPVIGDWNGNGISKVGVFRLGFFWVLDANGNQLFDGTGNGQDFAFAFGGISGDKPILGKW